DGGRAGRQQESGCGHGDGRSDAEGSHASMVLTPKKFMIWGQLPMEVCEQAVYSERGLRFRREPPHVLPEL
ncbi:MAG TPA: hypothetical protein VN035_11500, partial [Microbacterium sp.]|nr:hypothetical protein [Microbacterium sp.]